jgi:8-oxo-dGTP diphosphatase
MDYNLLHRKRKLIFGQFLYNKVLSFSELERLTKIRSNELAYFLDKLEKEGILLKDNSSYRLSKGAELYIPFFADKDSLSPLPVVLVQCVKDGRILLFKRSKRPYKDFWSLPGGRIKLDETIAQASERIIKEKTFLDSRFVRVNSVLHEKAKGKEGSTLHAYIILFVTVDALSGVKDKDVVRWFDTAALPDDMIPSDRHLVEMRSTDTYDLGEEIITMDDDADRETLEMEFL